MSVDRCRFEGLLDDGVNVHGTAVQVLGIENATTVRCRFVHPRTQGLRFAGAGDRVQFLDAASTVARSEGTVTAVGPCENTASGTEFSITFEQPVPTDLVTGDALENLIWTPAVTITGSYFGHGRARGALATTPQPVLIAGNTFASSGSAVLITGDANWWFVTGAVQDLTITDNTFTRSRAHEPWHPNRPLVTLEDCGSVTVTANQLDDNLLSQAVERRPELRPSAAVPGSSR